MSEYDPNYVPVKNYVLVGLKAVVTNKDKVLLMKRSDKVSRTGGWDLCGGGLDKDEDPKTGIVREIKEESGLDVEKITLLDAILTYERNGDQAVILAWHAETAGNEVTLSWEHDKYRWVTKEEAMEEPGLPQEHKDFISKALS
jgi:8-oxo-dGTP diphosphatase